MKKNNKNSILNNNNNSNYNLVTVIRQNQNLKVMKLINNISNKKKFNNLKKSSNTAINSTKNSKEKNKLKILQPKIHAIIKKYYLQKYLDKWKDNIKKQRIKNMQIISKWLKKKYDIEKDKKLKRRNELLKRIVNNLIKTKKSELKIPLRLWKRIASILTDKLNATIIQQFCRAILFKKLLDRKHNQNKLINLILNLYKKNLLKEILEPEPYQQIKDLIELK